VPDLVPAKLLVAGCILLYHWQWNFICLRKKCISIKAVSSEGKGWLNLSFNPVIDKSYSWIQIWFLKLQISALYMNTSSTTENLWMRPGHFWLVVLFSSLCNEITFHSFKKKSVNETNLSLRFGVYVVCGDDQKISSSSIDDTGIKALLCIKYDNWFANLSEYISKFIRFIKLPRLVMINFLKYFLVTFPWKQMELASNPSHFIFFGALWN